VGGSRRVEDILERASRDAVTLEQEPVERTGESARHGHCPPKMESQSGIIRRLLPSPFYPHLRRFRSPTIIVVNPMSPRFSVLPRWLEGLSYDLRFALRGLWRDRAFTFAATAMLALAIGLNVTVFTVMDAMLFRGAPLVKGNDGSYSSRNGLRQADVASLMRISRIGARRRMRFKV
jgi:hypothetical protein